jgi:hypothetical protein
MIFIIKITYCWNYSVWIKIFQNIPQKLELAGCVCGTLWGRCGCLAAEELDTLSRAFKRFWWLKTWIYNKVGTNDIPYKFYQNKIMLGLCRVTVDRSPGYDRSENRADSLRKKHTHTQSPWVRVVAFWLNTQAAKCLSCVETFMEVIFHKFLSSSDSKLCPFRNTFTFRNIKNHKGPH